MFRESEGGLPAVTVAAEDLALDEFSATTLRAPAPDLMIQLAGRVDMIYFKIVPAAAGHAWAVCRQPFRSAARPPLTLIGPLLLAIQVSH